MEEEKFTGITIAAASATTGQIITVSHASLFGGHLGRNRTLAHLSHRFYWSGMADDMKDWLRDWSSPVGHSRRLWTFSTSVTPHPTEIDTSSSSLTTSVNGQRRFPLRTNVQTQWQTCWWTKSYCALGCPWLYTGLMKSPYLDALKHEQHPITRNGMGWWNGSIGRA